MRQLLVIVLFLIVTSSAFCQCWIVTDPPNLSTFTWVNKLSASWSVENGLPVFKVPYHTRPAQWNGLTKPLQNISAYTVTMIFCASALKAGTWHFGITLQSTDNKAINMMLNQHNPPGEVIVYQEGNAQVYKDYEVPVAIRPVPVAQIRGFRIVENGTTRTYFYSADGGNVWMPLYSEPSGTYITPSNWGVIGVNVQEDIDFSYATLFTLKVTYP